MPNPSARRSRVRSSLAVIACLAVVAAACGDDDSDDGTSTESSDEIVADSAVPADTEAPTTEPDETESGDTDPNDTEPNDTEPVGDDGDDGVTDATATYPVVVEHALGSTEIAAEPLRVVALDRSLIDAALALEMPLVGYTTFMDPDGELPAYFGDAIDLYAADAEWVGDVVEPNLEAIAAVDPDLILTAAVRHEAIYDELSAIAPTVATESAGGGWKDNILLTAEAGGRTELAEQLIADYEERAAEVGAAINESAGDPTISVVRFVDAIRLYQPVSFSGVILEDAGLARPESQQDREEFIRVISEEELPLADADVLIYTVYGDDTVEEIVGEIQGRALWSTLGAVQRGDAHAVSDDIWMSGVGIFGAELVLDDLEAIFGVGESTTLTTDPPREDAATTDGASDAAAGGTISEVATAAGATFIPGYAQYASGYDAAINGAGPVTALMPDDAAFMAFGGAYPNLTNQLRADFELLDQLLLYHTIDGELLSAAIAEQTELATLQGEPMTVEVVDGSIVLNGGQATIAQADLVADNGVVQILDGILLPPSIAATAS